VPHAEAKIKVSEEMTVGRGQKRVMGEKQILRSSMEPPHKTGLGAMVKVMGYGEKRPAH
jgi:hypothetical protein